MISDGSPSGPGKADLLLVAEDNPADLRLIQLALEEHGVTCKIFAVQDGEAAVRFIETLDADRSAVCPVLAILDLNLPCFSGEEILLRVRASERLRQVPVIVATSSQSALDRAHVMQLGASAFFSKPADLDQFLKIGALVSNLLAARA